MSDLSQWLVERQVSDGRGEAPAVCEPTRTWSYAELAEQIARAASALKKKYKVAAGDRVGLVMHDSADFVAVFLAAIRVGAVAVPIPDLARGADVRALLERSTPRLVVAHADLVSHIDEVLPELGRRPMLVTLDELQANATIGAEKKTTTPKKPRNPNDPCFVLHSGPDAHGVAHSLATARAAYATWAEGLLHLAAGDRVFALARLSSGFGLATGLVFPLAAGAATCLMPERAQPRAVFEAIGALRPTIVVAVPSLWRQMADDLDEARRAGDVLAPFEGVRAAISGGEPLPARLHKRTDEMLGGKLLHGLGVSEALGFVLCARPGEPARYGSSGKPAPGWEARIVDDGGQIVGSEQIGALEVKGPSLAHESPRVQGGWLRTGDRGLFDRDGFYFDCGRDDGRFKVSGRWVAPDEVERALTSHAAIWECAVVAEEDSQGLLVPVAYVVLSVGQTPSIALGHELMVFVKGHLTPHKFPRRIEFVDELPRGPAGEVQRWRLRPASVATGKPPTGAPK